jgi:hypothetical protein
MKSACTLLCHLWPVWLYRIFPQFSERFIGYKKCIFVFSRYLSERFLTLRKIQRDIINVYKSPGNVPDILVRFYWNLNFLNRFSKNPQIWNFMKSVQWVLSFLRTGWRTNRQHDEANSQTLQFCKRNQNYCGGVTVDLNMSYLMNPSLFQTTERRMVVWKLWLKKN